MHAVAERLQFGYEEVIGALGVTVDCRRPLRFGVVDCPAAIGTPIAGKPENHDFLLAALDRAADGVGEAPPDVRRDLAVEEGGMQMFLLLLPHLALSHFLTRLRLFLFG